MRTLLQYIFFILLLTVSLTACNSTNCPFESLVTCNYGFYDVNGTPINYSDEITVTTLLPGSRTIYVYRKLGFPTQQTLQPSPQLIEEGYTETSSLQRCDTVLVNRLSKTHNMSLPMSYFNTADTLILSYASLSLQDTIYIEHESYPYVDLPECGAHRFHNIKSISTNAAAAIDHIDVLNSKVNYEGRENIRIYFNGEAD